MNDQKLELIEKIKGAKNVLVTVSANPSVDQLAAAIALTLVLNKLDKHGTAVYSGETPSTIEFLQPKATIEKDTNSLRDFIISLDKTKADKLRYKVEERVVKIFITPYRTSLSQNDFDFSQGDFNVDLVIALGVHHQQELDNAITEHGRILHDAVVTTINDTPEGDLGSLNWQDLSASSLSEQIASLAGDLGSNLLDEQISTALLTGIVAETERFRNTKTTPRTMSISAELMAAGANQQLVASELERKPAVSEPEDVPADSHDHDDQDEHHDEQPAEKPKNNDGTLEIEHPEHQEETHEQPAEAEQPEQSEDDRTAEAEYPDEQPEEHADDQAAEQPDGDNNPEDQPEEPSNDFSDNTAAEPEDNEPHPAIGDVKGGGDELGDAPSQNSGGSRMITEAPSMGGVLTANSRPEGLDPSTDPLSSGPANGPMLTRDKPSEPPKSGPSLDELLQQVSGSGPADSDQPDQFDQSGQPADDFIPPLANDAKDPQNYDHETLTEIEADIHHEDEAPTAASGVDSARQAVEDAIKGLPTAGDVGPINALNAQPLAENLQSPLPAQPEPQPVFPQAGPVAPADTPLTLPPTPFDQPAAMAAQPNPFGAVDPNMPLPNPMAPITPPIGSEPAPLAGSPADQPFTMPLPPSITMPPVNNMAPTSSPNADPQAPPPVPPPMMPPGFGPPQQ